MKQRMRNSKLLDGWSLVHFCLGIALGFLLTPLLAIALMIGWEPIEIFILSPIFARFNIDFGYEAWINSLSDIIVDTAGVLIGAYLLR